MDRITITNPFDGHAHLRDNEMLEHVAIHTAKHFSRAVIMPNLVPPICSVNDVVAYRRRILKAIPPNIRFDPLMTFKLMPNTDPDSIAELAALDYLVAGKLYPAGVTTNSDDGVSNIFALEPVFKAMEKQGLVLCLHGEMPGEHILERDQEHAFLRTLKFIAVTYPDLQIVLEHITTDAAVEAVLSLPNVAATITVHHLLLTVDDVGGCPVHYCKPGAKTPKDRASLIQAAISGCPWFFFGSDSAPHPRAGKERLLDCCAGIFSAPVALPLLAEIFERENALDRLQSFVSDFGRRWYGLPEPDYNCAKHITLVKRPWTVPDDYKGIVPFRFGQTLDWSVEVQPS